MKPIILALFLCLPSFTRGQTKNELLEKLITQADNYDQLASVVDIIRNSNIYYEIPAISPLPPNLIRRVSSKFGWRKDPVTHERKFHAGIDLAAHKAVTIHATANGKVTYAGWQNGYGNLVIIKHKLGFIAYYGHMSMIYTKVNAYVTRGTIIGFVGSTGKSTGQHLHYEIKKNGKPVNPGFF